MKGWQLYIDIRLWLVISLSGFLSIVAIQPGWAEKSEGEENKSTYVTSPTLQQEPGSKVPQLSELEIPITSAQQLLVQSPTPQTTPLSLIHI